MLQPAPASPAARRLTGLAGAPPPRPALAPRRPVPRRPGPAPPLAAAPRLGPASPSAALPRLGSASPRAAAPHLSPARAAPPSPHAAPTSPRAAPARPARADLAPRRPGPRASALAPAPFLYRVPPPRPQLAGIWPDSGEGTRGSSWDMLKFQPATGEGLALYSPSHPSQVGGEKPPRS